MSDAGDLLYCVPKDFKSIVAAKSFWLRVSPLLSTATSAAQYIVRVAFGTTLLASIAAVYASIFLLMATAQSRQSFLCSFVFMSPLHTPLFMNAHEVHVMNLFGVMCFLLMIVWNGLSQYTVWVPFLGVFCSVLVGSIFLLMATAQSRYLSHEW